jgi:hypothetical protein
LFIFGSPRSGTTWLGKVFDSHPTVRYVHEPEIAAPPDVPQFVAAMPSGPAADALSEQITTWSQMRTVRTMGTRPIFRKAGEATGRHAARLLAIYVGKALHAGLHASAFAPAIPDPCPRGADLTVIKSVNLLGRAAALLRAAPGIQCVLLVRHPCGQIASVLRGVKKYGERNELSYSALPSSRLGQREGLTLPALAKMSPTEILAWKWAAFNDAAYDALKQHRRAHIVIYDEIMKHPHERTRALFGDLGIAWHARIDQHITACQTEGPANRHYGVRRDPRKAAVRWQHELSREHQRAIYDICARSSVARELFGIAGAFRATFADDR